MKSPTETEVKIRLSDRPAAVDRLQQLGFKVSVPRAFESNTIYDTGDQRLRQAGTILRLRQVGSKAVITWKGAGEPGRHKSRQELETSIGSLEALHQILGKLGYDAAFRYEKYRTEFVRGDDGDSGVVTVDETPIGNFLELEGPGDWIDRTAKQLGFSEPEYILDSYGKLYIAECERRGLQPTHMVFTSHP
ncbi:MAG: class IV adenylate cyclase [Acidobacteriaceae bacterium]|nr:class IV adenylate cyclase [Acidobacteriaceae bacterium]